MAEADGKKEALSFYEEEEHLTKLCNFLRSNEGPPVREAVEMDKRVYYLKGKKSLTRRHCSCLYVAIFVSDYDA